MRCLWQGIWTACVKSQNRGGNVTRQELIGLCMRHPDAYEDYPFDQSITDDAWTAMRHRSNRKTFAFIFRRGEMVLNLKCDPVKADQLRQLFEGITPAYHMNKNHWNTVRPGSDVPAELLEELIEDSYRLTLPKKPKITENNR